MIIDKAYITVITNSSYIKGLTVLWKSFQKTHSKIPFYVMLPTDSPIQLKQDISSLGVKILEKESIQIDNTLENTNKCQAWNQTFFKLNIMNLTQFKKLVYIDSDMIIMKNLDHLFGYTSLSATTGGKAAHPEWIEFNSGLMVIEPDHKIFTQLIEAIPQAIYRKQNLGLGFGDQDVFNEVFPAWTCDSQNDLGEVYNAEICFLEPLMRKHQLKKLRDLYVLHYIGYPKIWQNTLIKNLQILHGCISDKNYFQARAWLLYMQYLYL